MRRYALILGMFALTADAAPQVDIRAHTRLALTRVRQRGDDQIEVFGQLVDKLTSEGIAGQTVTIALSHPTTEGAETAKEQALTQSDGSFHQILEAGEPGPVHVVLGFAGNRVLEAADPLIVDTDPAKQQVELQIVKISDDATGARIHVSALGDDGPIDVPIVLSVALQGHSDFHKVGGQVIANQADVVVARKAAGGPGMYQLRAVFGGDEHTASASREVLLELPSQTRTAVHVRNAALAYEDDLVATGVVTDDDGQPIAEAAVALMAGERRLAQATTEPDGHYAFRVEAAVVAQRERDAGSSDRDGTVSRSPETTTHAMTHASILVTTEPNQTYVKPSRSPAVEVTIAAPQPVPVSYTIAAFVATGLFATAFFLARTHRWQRLRKSAPPVEDGRPAAEREATASGLIAARPSLIAALRRPHDHGISGMVRDTMRHRPIAGALVRVTIGEMQRDELTDASGAFALEGLPLGQGRGEVSADGHVTERFGVAIPHRGELRGVRIELVPVRERVFELYRRAAEPMLPESRLWGVWSPRQIVDHVRDRRPRPALAELTDFVEEIYFGPRLPAEGVLPLTTQRVDRAIAEGGSNTESATAVPT